MDADALAACSQFPTREKAILDLLRRDETFRELCADFATAEKELSTWTASEHPLRDHRISEFAVLVQELADEIATMLDAASVVSFPRR